MRILGIDPGSRLLGYGIVDFKSNCESYVVSGCIRFNPSDSFIDRIGQILPAIQTIVTKYQPTQAVIEDVFFAKNASSALKLGQARGAVIAAIRSFGIEISEYSPRSIKQALVGSGAASKDQVSFMVQNRLSLTSKPQVDAGDALAVALCHIQHIHLQEKQ